MDRIVRNVIFLSQFWKNWKVVLHISHNSSTGAGVGTNAGASAGIVPSIIILWIVDYSLTTGLCTRAKK